MMELSTLVINIVGFVFTTVSTTVITKATEGTLEKINILRDKVIKRLSLKPKAKAELEKKEEKDIDLEILKSYLQTEMIEDEDFAKEIKSLVEEINQDLEQEKQGTNVINVYGGKAYQQNQNQGKIYNAERITINEKE